MHVNPERLRAAWERARRGSKAAGIDGITPDLFAGVAEEQLNQLARLLAQERYCPQPTLGVPIRKRGGRQRLLGIATVQDRIVQRWLLRALYPALEEALSPASYAYRPGCSIHQAVGTLRAYWKPWLLKADIAQFFDALAWPVLLAALDDLALDPPLQQLVEQYLQAGWVLGGQQWRPTQGVAQGSVLSGALANLYWSEFDWRCLRSGWALVRYGDDFAIPCDSRPQAERCHQQLEQWLGEVHLKLAPEKTRIIAPGESFHFLGYELCDRAIRSRPRQRPSHRHSSRQPASPPAKPRPTCSRVPRPSRLPTHLTDYWRAPMTTLYVTEQGAQLRVKHQQFKVFCQRQLRCELPVNQVSHIVLFGTCNLTHGAVRLALRRRIPVFYLSCRGKYFGRLEATGQATVTRLTQQVQRSAESAFGYRMASAIVQGKLRNSRLVLQRLQRRRPAASIAQAIEDLETWQAKAAAASDQEQLRGFEGQGARAYFQGMAAAFVAQPFAFEKRTLRPPRDAVNSLLSLGYTLLSQTIFSQVLVMGLHTHFGHLHVTRDQHPALVMDLMEEWRAPLVDSLVVYLVNARIFDPEDFTPPDARKGVYLQPAALRRFLQHWEERLQTEVTHPHTGLKVSYRRCMELQVREYLAYLMNERTEYRPMYWKM
ncbi:MAG: CRISPR-associated endonuclease Cas1 [Cyanobacteria bacterium QH_6_48_35]|jgi:CRISPR-associated endonuclease Cas1/group II intron reverse transcriptase/maturase|nr:MAG: CRISPR-associated endonuclease Cas1 [Cyanobacteria bacterium QH_6_48_35]